MWRKDNTRPENYFAVFRQCRGHSSLRESEDLVERLDGVGMAAVLNEQVELQSRQTERWVTLVVHRVERPSLVT